MAETNKDHAKTLQKTDLKMTIYRYPGGKSKKSVQERILRRAPSTFLEYREPFVGGGGIFFGLEPMKHRWINDVHPGLMAVYQALQNRPEQFIRKCRSISIAQPGEMESSTKRDGKKYNARLGQVFREFANDTRMDQALRYFFINRTVWAGRVNYKIPSRLYYSNPSGWNIIMTDRLEKASDHLQGAVITTGDYHPLFELPGKDVWIYADPPYVTNTNMVKTDQQYEYNFTWEDHQKLAKAVKKCSHKVCLSYDDKDCIRELYAGLNFYTEEWKYSGSSLSKKKLGKELLITNY